MTVVNKTYQFINNSGLPITSKTAEVRVGGHVRPFTLHETPDTLTISATLAQPIDGDVTIRVQLVVDVGLPCPKEYIDTLPELLNSQFISLHFRGGHRANVIESNFRFKSLSFDNIFNACQGVTYKYAPQIGGVNWNSISESTPSQLQTLIDSGPSQYSIRIAVTGYNQGSDCGICMNYVTQSSSGSASYTFQGISQDVIVWLNQRIEITSAPVTSGTSVEFSLIGADYPNNLVGQTILTLAQLNSAVAALPVGQPYGIQIWATYAGSTVSGTVTLNNITI